MKRTIAYVDGYNFYYGLLKGTPHKWLDPAKLVRSMLHADNELIGVRYFTSLIKTYPHDAAALDRQKVYLQALSAWPGIEVVQGYYSKNVTVAPVYDDACKKCATLKDGMVRVVKLEEKRTDVNIATSMLMDAFADRADVFVLVSGDTDFIGPVTVVRKDFKKTVVVLNPHDRISWLRDYASYYRDIPRDLPARCQLPDDIPIGTHGNFIRRPAAWR